MAYIPITGKVTVDMLFIRKECYPSDGYCLTLVFAPTSALLTLAMLLWLPVLGLDGYSG